MYSPGLLIGMLLPIAALLAVGVGVPIERAISESFELGPSGRSAFSALLDDPVYWRVLLRTIVTAGVMTLVALLLAYPTAEFIARRSNRVRPLLLGLVLVPLWSATVARTYGWVGILVRDGLADRVGSLFGADPLQWLYTRVAVSLGMLHALIPLLVLPVYAALRGYDESLTQASLSLGAGRTRTLFLVKLPVLAPALLAASAAVFVLALGFFETPALLGGPTSQLVSNLIGQQVFSRFDIPRAEAMSLTLLVAALVALAVLGGASQLTRRMFR
jgi:mannopine transport system permease protein